MAFILDEEAEKIKRSKKHKFSSFTMHNWAILGNSLFMRFTEGDKDAVGIYNRNKWSVIKYLK